MPAVIAGNARERGIKCCAHALGTDDVLVDLERARRLAANEDGVREPLRQLERGLGHLLQGTGSAWRLHVGRTLALLKRMRGDG